MRPTQHPKVASVSAGLSIYEPFEAHPELWRRRAAKLKSDYQFAIKTLTLFIEGTRGQTQGTPRLTNAFRFVPMDPTRY
jgi:hypothetical protein